MMTLQRIVVAALLATCLPGAAASKDFEQRVHAEPGGQLRVDLRGGSVVIESHGKSEVRVDALAAGIGAPSLDLELRSRDDEVTLRGGARSWFSGLLETHVRVRVRVPREFSIDVRTRGGSIEVEDIEGDVETRTSGGRISVGRIEGDVELETSGGALEANQIDGSVRARTSGGPIRLIEIDGDVDARTSGGPIEVLDAGDSVDARTSGGSIRVRFLEDVEGRLETSGGNIDVELPAGEGVDLDARTSGGRIEIDAAFEARGRIERDHVDAELDGGGDDLHLRTSGGWIRIHSR
jgi:hypothetical protein